MKKKAKVNSWFYLMTIPMMILFFIFHTIPFLEGIFYSFTDWKGYGRWNFVGLRNFIHIFTDPNVVYAYKFTLKYAIVATILVNVLSLIFACALNSNIKFKNFLKSLYFLPYMLGTLIVGYVFNYIFANIIPMIGKEMGISFLEKNILGTSYAWLGVLFVSVWKSMAFNVLIYLSGLQTVDQDIYEAASLDGAQGIQRFLKITFPLIAPFFTINMVLCAKNFLMAFDEFMAMTAGGPGTLTTTISLLIYKKGFQGAQFAYQSANAVLLFIVVIIVSIFQLRVLEKREMEISE